jgi:flagellar motor switch/type III secretory pathway protein FliN
MHTNAHLDTAVQRLDLTGTERKLAAGELAFGRVVERFVKGARRFLPFLGRLKAALVADPVRRDAAIRNPVMQGPSYVVRLADGDGGWGILLFETQALAFVLEGTLGADSPGASGDAEALLGKELTGPQKMVLARACQAAAVEFAQAVRTVTGLALDVTPGVALRAGAVLDTGKDALRIDCRFDGIEVGGVVSLYLGAEALSASDAEEKTVEAPYDPAMQQALLGVNVDVVAELGSVELGLRQLLSLQPGDTLRLSTAVDDPVTLTVAGVPKFDAVPVIARGQMAVQVKGRRRSTK